MDGGNIGSKKGCTDDSPGQRTSCQEEYLSGDLYPTGGEDANGKNCHDIRDDDAKIEGRDSNVTRHFGRTGLEV